METRKILVIVVLALGLVLCWGKVSEAGEMGTAFTYQGRLMDADEPASGQYDFQFELYTDPCLSSPLFKVGDTITVDEVETSDGHFTVELDFNSPYAFTGDARWLEVGVRPGERSDPCEHTILSPRQEVTPTPYAIYAQSSAGLDASGDVVLTSGTGEVEIGTPNEPADMNVAGSIRANDAIKCGNTIGFWPEEYILSDTGQIIMGKEVSGAFDPDIKVGIGTPTPEEKLTVVDGTIKCTKSGTGGWAVHGEASGAYGQGIYGYGTAFGGRGVYGKAGEDFGVGVYGKAIAEGQVSNFGGYFEAAGDGGLGIYGTATATGSVANIGGSFSAAGDSGKGVYGKATATGEVTNYGAYFEAAGDSGRGVYGECDEGRGVHGKSTNGYAGYFEGGKNYFQGNVGIGTTNPLSNLSVGGDGVSEAGIFGSGSGTGVHGAGYVSGVYGEALFVGVTGSAIQGVHGDGSSYGVYGLCNDGTGLNVGVYAEAGSDSSNNAYAVEAKVKRDGTGTYYSGHFSDDGVGGAYLGLYADLRTGGPIDLAEYILDTYADTEPGDVLAADPDNNESVVKANEPFDSSVVGIVSTKP
ncbi:MAG: hypothetical protein ACYTBJ_21435, partial [Planctomycetota bacterium]